MLNRLVKIKDFGNRGVSDHRLIIALHVVFRLVIACIFAWAVNRDHAGMNTNLMVCAAVVDSMGEAVGQHLLGEFVRRCPPTHNVPVMRMSVHTSSQSATSTIFTPSY